MPYAIEDVEGTQAELDQLYGEISARRDHMLTPTLLILLQAIDTVVAETRDMALSLERTRSQYRS